MPPDNARDRTEPTQQDSAQPSRAFLQALMEELPRMRGPAFMMARERADAYDLIQTTALRAITAHHSFTLGTNMRAWLYRIMRNEFIDLTRGRRHVSGNLENIPDSAIARAATQEQSIQMRDVMRAFQTLPHIPREALYLRCAEGRSYDEIAEIQNCAVGTVKSRIARAREHVRAILDPQRFADENANADDADWEQSLQGT